jgi:hypothetical protein
VDKLALSPLCDFISHQRVHIALALQRHNAVFYECAFGQRRWAARQGTNKEERYGDNGITHNANLNK